MRRELTLGVQPRQVDDSAHGLLPCGPAEAPGHLPVPPGEVTLSVHRVDQKVGDANAAESPPQVALIGGVTLADLDLANPGCVQVTGAGEHADGIPGVEEARHEESSDIAGGAGDECGAGRFHESP